HGIKPALLCNVTTAIGLLSLYTSELTPIRKFGLFSAIGVMAMLTITFLYMPAALQIWPQKPRKKPVTRGAEEPSLLDRWLGGFFERCGAFIIRNHAPVAIACVLVIVGVGSGVL